MVEPHPRSPIASSPLSIVLFARALSTETQDALHAWKRYLDTLGRKYEIFLIQEMRSEAAPSDDLAEEVRSARLLPYDRLQGYREALNGAIQSAQYPLIAFCPADKQYQPGDLERLLKMIDPVDLVAGYRTGGQAPMWRVLLDTVIGLASRVVIGFPMEPRRCWLGGAGWGRRLVARWIFGVRMTDPECPFRLARRAIFEHLPIQSGGPFVQVEMLAKANHLGFFFTEEGVSWAPPLMHESDAISFGQDAAARLSSS